MPRRLPPHSAPLEGKIIVLPFLFPFSFRQRARRGRNVFGEQRRLPAICRHRRFPAPPARHVLFWHVTSFSSSSTMPRRRAPEERASPPPPPSLLLRAASLSPAASPPRRGKCFFFLQCSENMRAWLSAKCFRPCAARCLCYARVKHSVCAENMPNGRRYVAARHDHYGAAASGGARHAFARHASAADNMEMGGLPRARAAATHRPACRGGRERGCAVVDIASLARLPQPIANSHEATRVRRQRHMAMLCAEQSNAARRGGGIHA